MLGAPPYDRVAVAKLQGDAIEGTCLHALNLRSKVIRQGTCHRGGGLEAWRAGRVVLELKSRNVLRCRRHLLEGHASAIHDRVASRHVHSTKAFTLGDFDDEGRGWFEPEIIALHLDHSVQPLANVGVRHEREGLVTEVSERGLHGFDGKPLRPFNPDLAHRKERREHPDRNEGDESGEDAESSNELAATTSAMARKPRGTINDGSVGCALTPRHRLHAVAAAFASREASTCGMIRYTSPQPKVMMKSPGFAISATVSAACCQSGR